MVGTIPSRPIASNKKVRAQQATNGATPPTPTIRQPPARSSVPSATGRSPLPAAAPQAHTPPVGSRLRNDITANIQSEHDSDEEGIPVQPRRPTGGRRPLLFRDSDEDEDLGEDAEGGLGDGLGDEDGDGFADGEDDGDLGAGGRGGRAVLTHPPIDFNDDSQAADADEDDEEDPEDDDDDDRTRVSAGSKRRQSRNSSESTRKRPKAGDYDGVTEHLLNLEAGITRAKALAEDAWPAADKSITLVEEAWAEALSLRPGIIPEPHVEYLTLARLLFHSFTVR